jgi:hypothetical protein
VTRKRLKGPFEIEGKAFELLKHAANYYGLKPNTVICRMRDGWTLEEALGVTRRSLSKYTGVSVTLGDDVFPSFDAAARHHGVDKRLAFSRVKAGYTLEQALGLAPFEYTSKPKSIHLCDEEYPSIAAACRAVGISKDVINARMNRYGWSLQQAFELEPRPGHEKGVVGLVYKITDTLSGKSYVGITMGTLDERWRQHCEVAAKGRHKPGTLHEAIAIMGGSAFKIEEIRAARSLSELQDSEIQEIRAAGSLHPGGYNRNRGGSGTRTTGIRLVLDGMTFDSYAMACRHFGLQWQIVKGRIRAGWTLHEAFELKRRTRRGGPKSVFISGLRYSSHAAAAKAFNLCVPLFSSRLRQGWTPEQAVELLPRPQKSSIVFEGRTFSSKGALAAAYGIHPACFYSRLHKGWSERQALDLDVAPTQGLTHEGKHYASRSQLARLHGVKPTTVHARLKSGWSLDEAIKTPVGRPVHLRQKYR